MEKSCRNCASKASPRPLFYFGKQPKQPLHARNSSRKTKKVKFIFSFEPSPY